MTLFADACALITFYAGGAAQMSPAAVAVMEGGRVAVSAVTVWEISRKVAIGKLAPLHASDEGSLIVFLHRRGFELRSITPEIGEATNALPRLHNDPMDRLLIAQALAERATVITNDRMFPAYGVPTLW